MKRHLKTALLVALLAGGHGQILAGTNELNIQVTGQTGQQQESVETINGTQVQELNQSGGSAGTPVPQPVIATTSTFDPYKRQDGPLKFMNCQNDRQLIRVFNANDNAMWVPFMEVRVPRGQVSAELKCATNGQCKIDMGPGTTARTLNRNAGFIVYNAKKQLKGTHLDAVKRGCGVFN